MMADHSLRVIQLTPPGRGAIATLRIEGPGALEAASRHFSSPSGRPPADFADNRLVVGRFGGSPGEEVVLRRLSDEAVEIHCHGGVAAVARIEQALVQSGAQRLSWQEWISRQEPDEISAAARIALAEARTLRTAAILADQYGGALRHAFETIQAALRRGENASARRQCEALRAMAPVGLHLVHPWQVVVAGSPNVGKSSLINALAGYPRSIVHSAPGTTRDAVTVETVLDGWPVELCDTAGLRTAGDAVERAGIELARRRMARADLVLLVFDRSQPWSGVEDALCAEWPGALIVYNKSDLPPAAAAPSPPGVLVSAVRGDAIDALSKAIIDRLVPHPPPPGAAVPFTQEQLAACRPRAG
ncbi:MAG: GTPase [Thermoguttaceae bacterium]|jgi:tRNA modification GTPase